MTTPDAQDKRLLSELNWKNVDGEKAAKADAEKINAVLSPTLREAFRNILIKAIIANEAHEKQAVATARAAAFEEAAKHLETCSGFSSNTDETLIYLQAANIVRALSQQEKL